MITTVLERYDSDSGEFAEIEQTQDGMIRAQIYGNSFETIFSCPFHSLKSARESICSILTKPYTKTTLKGE